MVAKAKRTTYRVIRVGVDGAERLVTWSYDLERACNAACGCALIANIGREEAAGLTGMDAAMLLDPLPAARYIDVRQGLSVLRRVRPCPCEADLPALVTDGSFAFIPAAIQQSLSASYQRRMKRRLALESSRTPEEVREYRRRQVEELDKVLASLEAEAEEALP